MATLEQLEDRVNFLEQIVEDVQQKISIPTIAQMLDVNFYKYFTKMHMLKEQTNKLQQSVNELNHKVFSSGNDDDYHSGESSAADKMSQREVNLLAGQLQKELADIKKLLEKNSQGQKEIVQQIGDRSFSQTPIDQSKGGLSQTMQPHKHNTLQMVETQILQEQPSTKISSSSQPDYGFKFQMILEDLDQMKFRMSQLATQEQHEILHKNMTDLASLKEIKKLQEHFNNFTPLNKHLSTKEKIKNLLQYIDKDCVKKEDLEFTFQFYKEESQMKFDQKLSIEAFQEKLKYYDSDIVQRRFQKTKQDQIDQEKRILKQEDDIRVMKKDIQEIKSDLNKKTYNEETVRIWKHFGNYAEYNDLKDLYNKVIPQLGKFEENLVELNDYNFKTQEIVKRFDEVLSEKASKQNIREIYEKIDDYVLEVDLRDYKGENNNKFVDIQTRQAKLDENLDILGQSISKDIYTAVRKATGHLGAKGGNQGGTTFSFTEEELWKAIESKADKTHLNDFHNLKSNKIDTENALRWIELLHKQIKHLGILQTETLKSILKDPNMSEHSKTTKLNFLTQQSEKVSHWINKFDSQNINEYFMSEGKGVEETMPEDLVIFEQYQSMVKKEIQILAANNGDSNSRNKAAVNRIRPSTISPLNIRFNQVRSLSKMGQQSSGAAYDTIGNKQDRSFIIDEGKFSTLNGSQTSMTKMHTQRQNSNKFGTQKKQQPFQINIKQSPSNQLNQTIIVQPQLHLNRNLDLSHSFVLDSQPKTAIRQSQETQNNNNNTLDRSQFTNMNLPDIYK